MNIVLWLLAVPTVALGITVGALPRWFDGTPLTPTLATSVLGVGLALIGVLTTYGAWRAAARRYRRGAKPFLGRAVVGDGGEPASPSAHAENEPAATEAYAIAHHEQVYSTVLAGEGTAADPADPGRLLLGRLHRHAAQGFHLDAVCTAIFVRPVLAAADLVRFLDREVVEAYVHSAGATPGLLGALIRRSQTGNVQTYLSALLAGAVVLAVLAVLVAVGA
jgi:NADH-quinone oxidoreductase subunit L